jgi:mannose-6-phosphate isomerase-like protein (cupin superfamily)
MVSPARIQELKSLPMVDLQTRHFFGGGVCIKRMEMPAGTVAVTHKHLYDHQSILAEGRALVVCDGVTTHLRGGDCITIKAGMYHEIQAIEDITWFCIHKTNETDEAKIDQVLIQENSKCL